MQRSEKKWFIGFALLAILLVVGLGRLEFHNELEQDRIQNGFLGYADETMYQGTVAVDAARLPVQLKNLGCQADAGSLFFAQPGRIGMFADLVYYENRMEVRSWFSGKLLQRSSEYYYKLDGPLHFQPVYETLTPTISIEELKEADYDYTSFRGK